MFEGSIKRNSSRKHRQGRRRQRVSRGLHHPCWMHHPHQMALKHRWIRAENSWFSMIPRNVSAKIREGWELVRADEYPDFEAPVVDSGKYEGVFRSRWVSF
jgi:hypothetical protein